MVFWLADFSLALCLYIGAMQVGPVCLFLLLALFFLHEVFRIWYWVNSQAASFADDEPLR